MRKVVLALAMTVLYFIQSTSVFSQTNQITGTITDAAGTPIPGASIKVKGAKYGTSADFNGLFKLALNNKTTILVSAVGYESKEVSVAAGASTIHVQLSQDTKSLSEVVVTGVGVATSKKKVPIDVATVSAKDFPKSATTSVEQALIGQVAGAQIQQTSGQPGANFIIQLRGFTNLGTSQPLILVDGVQTSPDNDILTYLDPSSIDRIEIVKGPAGGMLYGARGGNGVIQIFTKKGARNGKMNINFSSKVSVDNVLRGKRPLVAGFHHDVTDANGNILDQNGDVMAPTSVGFWPDPQELDYVGDPTVVNNKVFKLPIYDHIKQGYRTANTTVNTLSLSGGTTNSDYSFTVSHLNQQDIFSNNYSRTNASINLGFVPVKGLTIRSITNFAYNDDNLLGGNRFNLVNSYQWINFKWRDSTGHLVLQPKNENQINSLSEREWHDRDNQNYRADQTINVNYKFNRFLELDYKYGIDFKYNDDYEFYKNQTSTLQSTLFWSIGSIEGMSAGASTRAGSVTDGNQKLISQNSVASLFFRTDFQNDFHLNIPLTTTTQVVYDWVRRDDHRYFAQGSVLPTYPPYNISSAQTKASGDYAENYEQYGVLFSQSFDYGNLFGISGGFRSDYSSVFGAGVKAFNFGRGAVYFRPSELFSKQGIITDWKLRAAIGSAGIDPGTYDNQVTLGVSPLGNNVSLSTPVTASNPYLRVQTTTETEIGTDLALQPTHGDWFSRIVLSGSYWKRTAKDVEQFASVAPSSGYGNLNDNLVSLSSHGVDLSLDATMLSTRNFTWNFSTRWGFAKTSITKIANGLDVISGAFALKEGKELGIFYGQTPLHSISQLMPDGKTPYIDPSQAQYYTLVNGNVVDTRSNAPVISASNDLSVIGNATPKFNASFINKVAYKDLALSFQFDWVSGNDIYNMTRQWLYRDRISRDFDDPITINGKTGAFVAYYNGMYNSVNPISWFVEKGSFVRLRDLSLTYDITNTINKKWLKKLTVTASGRNLMTFTKYHGLDPENTSATDSQGNGTTNFAAYKGVDYFGIPNLKSYMFSVNVGF